MGYLRCGARRRTVPAFSSNTSGLQFHQFTGVTACRFTHRHVLALLNRFHHLRRRLELLLQRGNGRERSAKVTHAYVRRRRTANTFSRRK